MKKLLSVCFCLMLFALCIRAQAQAIVPAKPRPFAIGVGTLSSQKGTALIRITVEDAKAKSGVCPYYVRSFQYLEAVKVLNVEVYQEVCQNDVYGFSSGEFVWNVPARLLSQSSALEVIVNQSEAGALVFDEHSQTFGIRGN